MKKNYDLFKILLCTFLLLFNAQSFAASKSHPVSDTVITGKVKAKIATDPSLSVFHINVVTNRGIVNLDGVVNSDTDAGALIELAQSTDGVKDVKTSHLQVKNSAQPFTDIGITAKVKGLFVREKIMGADVPATGISVETNNGVVYLSGNVDNKHQANTAINLAKSVKGVKRVESRINTN